MRPMITLARRLAALVVAGSLSVLAVGGSLARADDTPAAKPGIGIATFGSGCFWCTESDFDKLPGVLTTVSGYMGGTSAKPTYAEVSSGRSGHTEVLQVTFDTTKVTYAQLLHHYWRTTDVTDAGGQFCDRGPHYRPVIFTHGAEQQTLASEGKAALAASDQLGKPIVVEIAPAKAFTKAEDYHQNFHKNNIARYMGYRAGCGRDARLDALWGKDRLSHLAKPQS